MELKQIKELMSSMKREGIKKLSIKEKTGYELHLERQEEGAPSAPQVYHPPYPTHTHPAHPPMKEPFSHSHHHPHPHHTHHAHEETQEKKEEKPPGHFVTSPMVGTFYATPSPDDPAFVKVGDRVEEDTIVCIIEAMKVMNEVKAGVAGVIAEIYIENAHPVEFGTKIMRIV